MFEKALEDTFKKVFEISRVRYDQPAPENKEQETLFVEIKKSTNQVKDGKVVMVVEGQAEMWAQHEKLPFGFFSKAIAKHHVDCKPFFFYEIEANSRVQENIAQRGFSFIYFFNGQYDPELGTLNEVILDVETT